MSQHPPTRQRSRGSRERIVSPRHVAGYLRQDCRTLRDSLQLEMVVAQYLLQLRGVLSPEGVPVGDAASAGVVADLERHADPLSHVILRAMAYLATGDAAARSADAAARLAERGIEPPRKFADVTQARAVGAWRDTRGAYEGEYVLFVDFEYPLGAAHSLGLFVEPRHGGVIKHIGLMHPMSDFAPDEPFHPSALEPLDVDAAGALLRDLLDRSLGPRLADDYRVLIAAARARSMPQSAPQSRAKRARNASAGP